MLTDAETRRAQSWVLKIVETLLGREVPYTDVNHDRRWAGLGGFSVDRRDGAWYCFGAEQGGRSAVGLVKFLRPAYSWSEALDWVRTFLAANPGEGACSVAVPDDDASEVRSRANAAWAQHVLDHKVPIAGTDGGIYLKGRGLEPPYPCDLYWYPNDPYHVGDGAIVVELIAAGRTTGILLTYIDALGAKSLAPAARRRFDFEKRPDAAMVIREPAPGVVDISATIIIAEGLENALSIAHPEVANPGWKIIGIPGISALKNLPAKAGDRIIVFQDSDPEGHPAQIGLQAGIDNLILQGAACRRTDWSDVGDANAILQAKGPTELKRLLARPAGAPLKFEGEKLSIDGEIVRLAKLSPAEYEKERKRVAKDSAWRVTALDKAVARLRPEPAADEGSAEPSISLPVDPPWTGPVPQLGPLLDRIVTEIRRYVVLQEWQAHLVAIWVALTYFVFDLRIDLQVCPRLAIQSAAINSGKTALLRIVCTLARHGKLYGRATSAGIYRALSQAELTLCLDEVEFLRNDPYSPMMQVLDSSHHREDANILLTEPQKVGPPIARELSTWAAMALACNGQLPGSLQSRSIVVVLLRALASEEHEFLEKRSTPELIGLRRELTAWAATIAELPFPSRSEMPAEVYNRDGDNWRPMYAIGQLAGGPWPDWIREASLKAMKTETLPPLIASLLSSVDRAFGENPKPDTWLDSTELAARLIAQEGEPWGKINRGGPIDPYWLRTKFINLLDPPGAQDWWQPVKGGKRKHRSGYFYNQFADAFRRFPEPPAGIFNPDETHAETSPKTAGASGASREKPPMPRKTAIFDAPDGPGASGADRVHKKASKSAAVEPLTPLAPDAPGDSTPSSVCVSEPDEWGWADGAVEQSSTTEPVKPSETRNKTPRPTARSRRAKPNGGDPDHPSAAKLRASVLDMPEPSLIDYIEGSIADDIRQLRAANPKRSIKWIAAQCGQPASVVREILGDGEGAS